MPGAETQDHLETIGKELTAIEPVLAQQVPENAVLALVHRALNQQYVEGSDGELTLRPGKEVGASSLQSPHDPDATYRIKGGERYRGGYVINVSETADPGS